MPSRFLQGFGVGMLRQGVRGCLRVEGGGGRESLGGREEGVRGAFGFALWVRRGRGDGG